MNVDREAASALDWTRVSEVSAIASPLLMQCHVLNHS